MDGPPTPPPEDDIVDIFEDMTVDVDGDGDNEMVYVGDVGDMADDSSEDSDDSNVSATIFENIPCDKDDSIMTFTSDASGGQLSPVFSCCFGPDDNEIAMGSQNDLAMVWDLKTAKLIFETKLKETVTAVEYSFDYKYLVTGDNGGYIKVFLRKYNPENESVSFAQVFEYNTELILSWLSWHKQAHVIIMGTKEGSVYYFSIPSGSTKILPSHGFKTYCGALFDNGYHLAVGYRNNILKIWNMKTGQAESVSELFLRSEHVLSLDILNDVIIAGGMKGSVDLIGKQGRILAHLRTEDLENGSVEGIGFCNVPGTNLAASGTLEAEVIIWDVSRNVQRHSAGVTGENGDGIIGLKWIPGTTNFVTSHTRATIIVWDALSGKHLKILRGHINLIQNVTISKDGKRVMSACDDGTVKIYNL